MEEDGEMTPFWLETSDSRRRKPSSFFLNTGILIILLLVIAFAFVLFVIPSFLSLTSNIFKPQLVKKSWDSVNLVLVLFAIICGFLSNSSNNNTPTPTTTYEATTRPSPKHVDDHVPGSNPSTPSQWYDRTAYNSLRRLKSSSSYPDIRQEYSSWMVNGDDRWRFYDDTHLYNYRSRSRRQHDQQVYINNTKDIAVDTVCTSPQPPPQSPPPQLPKVVRRKSKRTHYEDAKTKERSERKEVIFSVMKISPPIDDEPEKRSSKSEKKTGGGGTNDFLISLRRKKKKQRQRSVENLEEFFNLSTLPLYQTPSPPPPPPPPPPPLPSFYQSIVSSKKSKARKHHSMEPPVTTQKPPFPVKINNKNNVEESMESGNESPLNPVPPPPPPPPFKLRPWKFEVQGDFVRIKSINSADSDDPSSGEASPSDVKRMGEMEGEDSRGGALFCPSPDVNTKADHFIARFRAGLTLEKMNSVRARSNLGPTSP
ncbi:hypothetical protein Goklo_002140 [Gossypium klotzschianum]|uniref:Hydroxyproline-rich glycoprotein family protein n=1 Tax=Gossypium klotzschianum TaxID=34286 RepID=A0A7J8VT80_9ROSI|nr:hypothetical protein [Gossypium klotzschianum]